MRLLTMTDRIGVGVIGANPEYSWAAAAHIPALASLPDYELRAVSTSRPESAAAAREKFGVPAFTDPAELAARPDIDLVVVSVGVPHHRALVLAALDAGKHVYCEWPLGNGLEETIEIADRARHKGVLAVIGLQARVSPVILRVRDLVAQGYVGRVLSTSIIAGSWVYGPTLLQRHAYVWDKNYGGNMLTIQTGHLADAVAYCLGEFQTVTASVETLRSEVRIIETGEMIPTSTPDQIALTGVLEGGAVASLHLRGGVSRATNLLWEINGTEGDLLVTGPSSHISAEDSGEPTLQGGRAEDKTVAPLPIPEEYYWTKAPKGPPYNVAQLYTQIARDLRNDTRLSPTFDTAVQRHRMLAAIQRAADTGTRRAF